MKQEWQLNSSREKFMRITTAILFVVGFIWAFFALFTLGLPFGIFMPELKYTAKDICVSFFGMSLSATGYWIWVGWLIRSWRQRYLFLSPRAFWMLVALNHFGWILFLTILNDGVGWFWPPNWPPNVFGVFFGCWLIGIFMFSIFVSITNPDKNLK